MKKDILKSPDVLFALLALLPLLAIYAYYFSSSYVLGYWPAPYHPDPKTKVLMEQIEFLYGSAYYLLPAAIASPFIYLALLPYRFLYYRERYLFIKIALYCSCLTIVISWYKIDPFRIIEWFFD